MPIELLIRVVDETKLIAIEPLLDELYFDAPLSDAAWELVCRCVVVPIHRDIGCDGLQRIHSGGRRPPSSYLERRFIDQATRHIATVMCFEHGDAWIGSQRSDTYVCERGWDMSGGDPLEEIVYGWPKQMRRSRYPRSADFPDLGTRLLQHPGVVELHRRSLEWRASLHDGLENARIFDRIIAVSAHAAANASYALAIDWLI